MTSQSSTHRSDDDGDDVESLGLDEKSQIIRARAEDDLLFFIRLIHPGRVFGKVHRDIIEWWARPRSKSHQLLLLPRDHQKSALQGYRVAWEITRNPAVRILYISSTAKLATKQLKFIKDILTSDTYRTYWPEMVNDKESDREKWTEGEISVDHPLRKDEFIRDPTVFTAGLTTNIVGLHCDIAVLDDTVTDDTAYNEEGRRKVRDQVSYLASIASTDSRMWAVGTRYHPLDLYNDLADTVVDLFDKDGNIVDSEHLWEVYERKVEDKGDGTGAFLWPRIKRGDGKWFGFNREILAKKKAQYADFIKFRAQYYNDPNDTTNSSITRGMFQYYNRNLIERRSGIWYYQTNRLNVFAAMDFAFSTNVRADYTCIAVIGVDGTGNYYILDLERFKTNKISDYFDRLLYLHTKWDFRKIRMETTVAQSMIVEELKNNYIRKHGLALSVEAQRPTKKKEERIEAILQPKYADLKVWHYQGGVCQLLEEEVILQFPPHDDIKDAVASAFEIAIPPASRVGRSRIVERGIEKRSRFGGF